MSVLEETKFLMKKYHITANKNLGQNFLIDDEIVHTIVDSSNISPNDLVIEIGPGLGVLTACLLEKARKVIAIELDSNMIEILQDRFQFYDNFELIHQDVLKVNLKQKIAENSDHISSVKVVANLPYYITTPIIMQLLEKHLPIESITVMVQKEVADRLTATPGKKNTGAITYCVSYYCEAKEISLVPNTCFIPSPEVNSEVIYLKVRKEPPVSIKNEAFFFKIIQASFMQRRKTLLNGLANNGIASKEVLKKMLSDLQLNENIRGEALDLNQFAKISDYLTTTNS